MSYASEVLADAPRAYYRMQETSGLIQDSSGFANHATSVIDGGLVYSPTGEPHANSPIESDPTNKAIGFVASDFSIPDDPDIDLGDTMTAEAWIYRSDASITRAISGRGSLALTWGIDGATNKLFIAKADTAVICLSTITIDTLTWYHVVYTKATTTNFVYINGVDRTGTVTNAALVNVATPLKVGSDYNDTLQWFGGLDEVAFYATALTQARVQAHYTAATTSTSVSDDPPIGFSGRGAGW